MFKLIILRQVDVIIPIPSPATNKQIRSEGKGKIISLEALWLCSPLTTQL